MPVNDYQKIKEIGSGSFGRAYLVQAPSSKDAEKKLLVLKEVDLSSRDAQQRAAAEVEVKVMCCLKHPYIVRYWESFMKGPQLCIVMDYCEGGDMWQYVAGVKKKRSTIPEAQITRWLTQMCLALKYMHQKNVLHRDIKSQNIFLSKKEGSDLRCAKIADFGIAKVLKDAQSLAQTLVGTPYYLSPEICSKQPYGSSSDIWAVGCVLFELCALRVPFDAQDLNHLVDRIVRGTLPKIPSSYSKELIEIGSDLLTRDAKQRPSAGVVLQRPLIQAEIKRMLKENKKDTDDLGMGEDGCIHSARAPSSARGETPRSARDGSRGRDSGREASRDGPRPLGEHNSRGRAPSLSKQPSARAPSPHKGAAMEVLNSARPSRAASPALRSHR
eukprot:TRINITY_DN34722_c0_g1_i1.p1 TRINITY_DN34722_c0_g1~~TRINITY_DN34722_c0_g1_i1.p1  ORF type:complete len:385 (+),score=79.58 TRINITY_DN34722_c0_g1_i1:102-1256(+)